MFGSTETLSVLREDMWSRVRDLTVPLRRRVVGSKVVYEAVLQEAIAYTGTPKAYRLLNLADSKAMGRVVELVVKIDQFVQQGTRRFRIEHDGMAFRAQMGHHADGEDIQLRILPDRTPALSDLLMAPAWRSLLLSQSVMDGGLILITAPTGQGKTTTASAIVRSRLERFGGFATTCEDPLELPIQGVWGDGICVQRPVHEGIIGGQPGDGYYQSLLDALRQFPAITGGGTTLFVGEIRDSLTAAETLKAAANGHLVIATLHAKSIAAALRRMTTLCSSGQANLSYETVLELMAECVRGVLCQRLYWQRDKEGWHSAKVGGELLWSHDERSAAAQHIRHGRIDEIVPLIERQADAVDALNDWQRESADEVIAAIQAADGRM